MKHRKKKHNNNTKTHTLTKAYEILNDHKIKCKKIKNKLIVCETIYGEQISYFPNGIIKSKYYEETGIDNCIKYCKGKIDLHLKNLNIPQINYQSTNYKYYMTNEALERKSKLTTWLYRNNIPYISHDAIVEVVRTNKMMPYETYDKVFVYNCITDIVHEDGGIKLLPRGVDTMINALQGLDYSYGVSSDRHKTVGKDFRDSPEYIETTRRVRARDSYRCRICGESHPTKSLEVHHLKSYTHYIDLRLDMDNMISACERCHKLLDTISNENVDAVIEIIKNRKDI